MARIKRYSIIEAPLEGCFCVDLQEDADRLPEGWHFVLRDNCYTGWSGGDGSIQYAEIERDENNLAEDPDCWNGSDPLFVMARIPAVVQQRRWSSDGSRYWTEDLDVWVVPADTNNLQLLSRIPSWSDFEWCGTTAPIWIEGVRWQFDVLVDEDGLCYVGALYQGANKIVFEDINDQLFAEDEDRGMIKLDAGWREVVLGLRRALDREGLL